MLVPNILIAITMTAAIQELTNFYVAASDLSIDSNSKTFWTEVGKIVNFFLNKCSPKESNRRSQESYNAILKDCLNRRGVQALDRALSREVIAITDNVMLVKWKNDTEDAESIRSQHKFDSLKAHKGSTDWYKELTEKALHFIRTRVVKISFRSASNELEARHRNKHNNSFGQMMMFGLVAAGLIVIPLGFQFLAVLGGKALLLAKLALLLTSIQGLKKIATSNVNYGLYSTGHGAPYHYDRHSYYEGERHPSTYYSSSAVASPISDNYGYGHSSYLSYNNLYPRGEEHVEGY